MKLNVSGESQIEVPFDIMDVYIEISAKSEKLEQSISEVNMFTSALKDGVSKLSDDYTVEVIRSFGIKGVKEGKYSWHNKSEESSLSATIKVNTLFSEEVKGYITQLASETISGDCKFWVSSYGSISPSAKEKYTEYLTAAAVQSGYDKAQQIIDGINGIELKDSKFPVPTVKSLEISRVSESGTLIGASSPFRGAIMQEKEGFNIEDEKKSTTLYKCIDIEFEAHI